MPSIMRAVKRVKGIIVDETVTPFNDYGAESIASEQEKQRLEKLGYEVEVIRNEAKIAKREGAETIT